MTEKEMLEVANFFLERNQANRLDYAEKYEKLLKKIETAQETEPVVETVPCVNDETKEKLRTDLKAFRLERSRQEKIKPYFIFNDAQMEDLIEKNPRSKEELCQVAGFGKVKADKYGEGILEILGEK